MQRLDNSRHGDSGGIGFRVRQSDKDALQRIADKRGVRLSDVARDAVERFVRAESKARP